jgi:penicillin-insensitive murein endopeptidase
VGARWLALAAGVGLIGCARSPTPLYPPLAGSIGVPHRGVLTGAVELSAEGTGYRFFRNNDRHHALARFAKALAAAAARVENERPGGTLVIGDLSAEHGGRLMPHLSHRSGRDADLLLYALTVGGAPIASPGFVHYGPDGLAWDEANRRFCRFDVEREWLLIRALLEDPQARIQWVFVNHVIEALTIEWARARGESTELVWRAEEVMAEPHPGGAHDDHIHVRTACDDDDIGHGCEPSGPARPWLELAAASSLASSAGLPGGSMMSGGSGLSVSLPTDEELVQELLQPVAGRTLLAAEK